MVVESWKCYEDVFFLQAEDGIRDLVRSRGLGDVYKRQGSRRTSSKLAGHLEPFCATRLLVARTRGLDIISQAEMLESFSHLRERESAIAIAGYLAELVDALVPEDERHEAVYDLLFAAYQLINDGGDERLVSHIGDCLLYTSPSPRDRTRSRMPSSA